MKIFKPTHESKLITCTQAGIATDPICFTDGAEIEGQKRDSGKRVISISNGNGARIKFSKEKSRAVYESKYYPPQENIYVFFDDDIKFVSALMSSPGQFVTIQCGVFVDV